MKKAIVLGFIFALSKATAATFDVYADALYWQTTETVDWALVISPSSTNSQKVTFETICFHWNPGFRVGVGFTELCDCWDTQFSYTYFRAHATNHTKGDKIRSNFFGPKLSLVGFFQEANIKTRIDYNIFDWELGRLFYPTPCISFRPMIGLKGGWIDQTLNTSWKKTVDIFNILIFPVTATENVTNNFWGIGPQGGVNGRWFFTEYFSLVGDFAAAFMWGHWSFSDQYVDSLISNIVIKEDDRNFGALMLQGFIGLGFDFPCFSLKVGYEVQDWFNQYQVFDLGTGGQNQDLLLQGLTAHVRFDF